MRAGAAVALAAFVLGGCGTSAGVHVSGPASTSSVPVTSTSTSAAPSGAELKTVAATGRGASYSMGVPATWTAVDPASGSPDEIAARIAQLYPNGADAASLADAIRQGLVLFAIDQESGASVNVFVQDQTVSLDLLSGQVTQSLASIGAATPTFTRLTVSGRDALRADTTITTPPARVTQVYVVTDTQTFITSITVPSAVPVDAVPIDAMIASITIV